MPSVVASSIFLVSVVTVSATQGLATTDLLPQRLRNRLLVDAEKTFEGETTMIPADDGSTSMTIAQRMIWQKNFQVARRKGLGLREAQDVALRGAVDGQVYDDDYGIEFDMEENDENRKVTCLACQFDVEDRKLFQEHYSCDWHCLNVQRKSSGLAPLSLADFEKRKHAVLEAEEISQRQHATEDARMVAERSLAHAKKQSSKLASNIKKLLEEDDRASHARADLLLEKKTEIDDVIEQQLQILRTMPPRTVQQSISSQVSGDGYTITPPQRQPKKPPRQASAAAEKRADAEERRHKKFDAVGKGVEEIKAVGEMSPLRCPFDGEVSPDLEAALAHLHTVHAFLPPFLPDLVDPHGLLAFLVRKVYLGCVCVQCGLSYNSPTAVQAHMAAKGHCALQVDDDFEEALGTYYAPLETGGAEAGRSGGKTMERLKREGLTRHGWRDASVGKAMLAAPTGAGGATQGGARSKALQDDVTLEQKGQGEAAEWRVTVGNGSMGGALWLVRRREAGRLSTESRQRLKKREVRDGYKNYFTRKAALGKVPMSMLNSGYRA